MKPYEIEKMIYQYIHEFEWENKRGIQNQEFIDAIPVIYHIIKDTKPEILGELTKEGFLLASQLGFKYKHTPSEIRKQFIQQEYEAIRRQK